MQTLLLSHKFPSSRLGRSFQLLIPPHHISPPAPIIPFSAEPKTSLISEDRNCLLSFSSEKRQLVRTLVYMCAQMTSTLLSNSTEEDEHHQREPAPIRTEQSGSKRTPNLRAASFHQRTSRKNAKPQPEKGKRKKKIESRHALHARRRSST